MTVPERTKIDDGYGPSGTGYKSTLQYDCPTIKSFATRHNTGC